VLLDRDDLLGAFGDLRRLPAGRRTEVEHALSGLRSDGQSRQL
jgi:hypothetical protein